MHSQQDRYRLPARLRRASASGMQATSGLSLWHYWQYIKHNMGFAINNSCRSSGTDSHAVAVSTNNWLWQQQQQRCSLHHRRSSLLPCQQQTDCCRHRATVWISCDTELQKAVQHRTAACKAKQHTASPVRATQHHGICLKQHWVQHHVMCTFNFHHISV